MAKSDIPKRVPVSLKVSAECAAMLDVRVREATEQGYPVERAPLAAACLERGLRDLGRDSERRAAFQDARTYAAPLAELGGVEGELARLIMGLAEKWGG